MWSKLNSFQFHCLCVACSALVYVYAQIVISHVMYNKFHFEIIHNKVVVLMTVTCVHVTWEQR